MYNRYNDLDIFRGEKADELLSNEVFQEAVKVLLNEHAGFEEELVCSNQADLRDATARIREHALMRRALLDVVGELNRLVKRADIAQHYADNPYGD